MNHNIHVSMQLIRSALYNDRLPNNFESQVDWDEVYHILDKNGILPMVYPVVAKNNHILNITDLLKTSWEMSALYCSISEGRKRYALGKILERAEVKKLTFIIFKGFVIAEAYPQPNLRTSCDSDILVYESELEASIQLLNELGYDPLDNGGKKKVYNFYSKEFDHKIELHISLWEDLSGSVADKLDRMDLAHKGSLIQVKTCNFAVITLGYTEHLIFQMFHIVKHFALEGISAKYLVDITVFINRHLEKIDQNRFWKCMEILGYSSFCMMFFEVCNFYLDLNAGIFNMRKRIKVCNMDNLLLEIINIGKIFDKEVKNWQIMPMMIPYLSGQKKIYKNRLKRFCHKLFPSADELSDIYTYAKLNVLLMPVAWLHRIIFHFKKKEEKVGEYLYDRAEKEELFNHKIKLMQSLGLFIEN